MRAESLDRRGGYVQAVPHGVQEPEVLLRVVRERGAKGREQAAHGRVPRNEE